MSLRTSRLGKRWWLIISLFLLSATGGCKQGPWTLWNSYAASFIDVQGRVIDPQGGDRTTSEGEAYAMFFALAGNDRATFDRLLNWTQANLANGDLGTHLPAWLWGKNTDGEWKTIDPNSASDADVWMAYALVEAGRLWKAPYYTRLGRQMMAQIVKSEVADLPGFGPMLLPASTGFQHGRFWTLNPSYMPLFIFERLAIVDPAGPWGQIASGIPSMLEQSARHGFAMDWVDYLPGDGFYPATEPHPGNKDSDAPGGSYDAIRVYLWAGMLDGSGNTRARMLSAVPAMSVYLANHDAPPEKVSDQGIPLEQDGPVGFSAAVLPYLRAFPDLGRLSARQTIRMGVQRNPSSGLYGKDLAYYDQNLALFATGFLGGRFRFGPEGELKVEWKR
ncbi:MAG: cellulose synthase complex periplasmic endoglucanase BcsZ [Terracidiphilus sp.]|jgi:endoglucanase